MRWIILILALVPAEAFANDGCHDLWFTRNQIMDRAGYCFGSMLGQTIFDNSDCTGKSVSISPTAKRMVREIQEMEKDFGCRVDTTSRWLDLDDMTIRMHLMDIPLLERFPGGCLGWLEPITFLHAGRSSGSPVIGRIEPGNYVSFDHWLVEGWHYVTARDSDWNLISGGWLRADLRELSCRQWAG